MEAKDDELPSLKQMREAIPQHCFKPSTLVSLSYIVQDVTLAFGLAKLTYHLSLQIEDWWVKAALWTVYGVAQGMIMTGIWILAHECGHQALFTNRLTNDSMGFVLHSMLLVPYFSWKYSHGLHHRYTNHMEKDTAFVPARETEKDKTASYWLEKLDIAEDAPAFNLALLVVHQLVGFPAYLLFYISAGPGSLQRSDRSKSTRQSHFDPTSDVFTASQHPFILLSDLGLAATLLALYYLGTKIGFWNVFLLYTVPYLWVNNWIVAITYLHHTHPSAAHFEADSWNYRDGALATVDRDFGFIGKHIFHGIIEFHVIHHLFTKIPFYHAEEATNAISKLLGKRYLRVETPFIKDLWETWMKCTYVKSSDANSGVLWWASSLDQDHTSGKAVS